MATLRQLAVRLGQDLEDKIEQKFGFREQSLEIPGYGLLEPRPRIEQVDLANSRQSTLATFAEGTADGGLPLAAYIAHVSRAIPESAVRAVNQWLLRHDDRPSVAIPVKVVSIQQTDDRWLVYLAVLKKRPFPGGNP